MCFISEPFSLEQEKIARQRKIAVEDIYVVKFMSVHSVHGIISPYLRAPYSFGIIKHSELYIENNQIGELGNLYFIVNVGLHSFKPNSDQMIKTREYYRTGNGIFSSCKFLKSIIPKGSEYFENNSEYVSNQLIVTDNIYE